MSEPTTKAGRALVRLGTRPDEAHWSAFLSTDAIAESILAIEQEAVRDDRERIAYEVDGLSTWVAQDEPATELVERSAVLALITPEDHDDPD